MLEPYDWSDLDSAGLRAGENVRSLQAAANSGLEAADGARQSLDGADRVLQSAAKRFRGLVSRAEARVLLQRHCNGKRHALLQRRNRRLNWLRRRLKWLERYVRLRRAAAWAAGAVPRWLRRRRRKWGVFFARRARRHDAARTTQRNS